MSSSVNAQPLEAVLRFYSTCSGLVAPAVTLATCARRASRLTPQERRLRVSTISRQDGTVLPTLATLLEVRIQGRKRFSTAKLMGCAADKRCWSDTCDPVFRYGKQEDLRGLQGCQDD